MYGISCIDMVDLLKCFFENTNEKLYSNTCEQEAGYEI